MQIQEFINQNDFFPNYDSFSEGVLAFQSEMTLGLSGDESSLAMLPTYISLDNLPDERARVIVMDAGGTNLRIALVSFDEKGAPITEYFEKYPMPGTKGEISKEDFFKELARCLAPVADKSEKIGFCFSFPCEVLPNLDGKILHFNKEVKVLGANGELLAENLRLAMKAQGSPANHSIVVINDTVATLLGAKAYAGDRIYGSYIGFILGTGINACYAEQNENITKSPELAKKSGTTLINMESGGFSKVNRTKVDLDFDSKTFTPNVQLLEKMISGAYQGSLLLAYIKAAASENCFSDTTKSRIDGLDKLNSHEVDEFCYFPFAKGTLASLVAESDADRSALYLLIDAFFERAASLTALHLGAIMKQANLGKDPLKPVCISAEGTTFYKCKLLHEKLVYYMVEYVERKMGIYFEFVKAENATISGTSIAALLHLDIKK